MVLLEMTRVLAGRMLALRVFGLEHLRSDGLLRPSARRKSVTLGAKRPASEGGPYRMPRDFGGHLKVAATLVG